MKRIVPCCLALFFSSLPVSSAPADNSSFPYGEAPSEYVCSYAPTVQAGLFATPETMLGSWAMLAAVDKDIDEGHLPEFLTSANMVYGVGTAALGDLLGMSGNCGGGCDQLNGYCFALRFVDKQGPEYMIFQSVNISAATNSIDVYMAGGGAGAYPIGCNHFWEPEAVRSGKKPLVDWSKNIENFAGSGGESPCEQYFAKFSDITTEYSVTYGGETYDAKETLIDACEFATQSGFNRQNFPESNKGSTTEVEVVPVSCPRYLTQVTGLRLQPAIEKTIYGTETAVLPLESLTVDHFSKGIVLKPPTSIGTTQMQDCQIPSSGYCNKPKGLNSKFYIPFYQASILASPTGPAFRMPPVKSTYCEQHENPPSFCTWDPANPTPQGGEACNASESACASCGSGSRWCTCDGGTATCKKSEATSGGKPAPPPVPAPPRNTSSSYCKQNPGASYCSWDHGESSGGDYCNTKEHCFGSCYSASAQWCLCEDGKAVCVDKTK